MSETGSAALWASLGEYAVRLARGASGVIVAMDDRVAGIGAPPAGGPGAIDSKSSDTDLVTVVDRASERWLTEQIARDRPDDAILGEEDGGRAGTSGVRWLLDPIDGTVNFVLGLPDYAVSVAVEVDGQVVAGAVVNPANGELFRAVRGAGAVAEVPAHRDGRAARSVALHGPRDVTLDRAVIGTGFGYRRELRARQGAVAARLLPRVGDLRRIGSAALDLCSVACGRLDGFYEVGLNPWDHSAGGLVAAEAGCVVGGLYGAPPGSAAVVAAGPSLAAGLFAVLEEFGAGDVGS